jgi:hypothetical protein
VSKVVAEVVATFERYWMQQIGVPLVRELAKVGLATAKVDWLRCAAVVAGAV